ncbi:MAG TPA: flavodoxin family protein [Syntrophorhabdaceae bacterium]|nr:flavodoxin family protein [Syntrophorhabdaceae bacterium]
MKVMAFNGSARKDGNTAILINHALHELAQEGIDTELIQFAGKKVSGCIACYKCAELKDGTCAVKDDPVNEWIDKMRAADAVILGSPVYFSDLTAGIKGFIERAGMVSRTGGDFLKHKIGAAVVAVRRAGAIHAFDSMNHFFLITQMIIVGANYWNTGIGRNVGEVESDREGIETMQVLGRNMAWLLKQLHP